MAGYPESGEPSLRMHGVQSDMPTRAASDASVGMSVCVASDAPSPRPRKIAAAGSPGNKAAYTLLVVAARSVQDDSMGVQKTADAVLDRLCELSKGRISKRWLGVELLEEEPENWPDCSILWTLCSEDLSLKKVQAYVEIRQPVQLNEVAELIKLRDRRHMLSKCVQSHVPVPDHVVCERDCEVESELEESEDYIVVDGRRLDKPFVEKPVDALSHDIFVYYPACAGGGRARLGTRGWSDATFDRGRARVRRSGSYVYEKFIPSEGFEMRLFVVGSDFCHAEARKTQAMAGSDAVSEYVPVLVNAAEKQLARRAFLAFGQMTFYLSLLRTQSASVLGGTSRAESQHSVFVHDIDVEAGGLPLANSLMKDLKKDPSVQDISRCLFAEIIGKVNVGLLRLRRPLLTHRCTMGEVIDMSPRASEEGKRPKGMARRGSESVLGAAKHGTWAAPSRDDQDEPDDEDPFDGLPETEGEQPLARQMSGSILDPLCEAPAQSSDSLLALLAIFRHGDRTPKQKVKLKLGVRELPGEAEQGASDAKAAERARSVHFSLGLVLGWIVGNDASVEQVVAAPQTAFNLRASSQLQRLHSVLGAAKAAAAPKGGDEKKRQCALVVPTKQLGLLSAACEVISDALSRTEWSSVHAKVEVEEEQLKVTLKWGGELTEVGERQAQHLGSTFHDDVYVGESMVRMHASLRHDLKVHSSTEPRCAQTAAAFARGLLSLDTMPLAAVQVSFVRVDEVGKLDKEPFQKSPLVGGAKAKAKLLLESGRPVDAAFEAEVLAPEPERYQMAHEELKACGREGKSVCDRLEKLAVEVSNVSTALGTFIDKNAPQPDAMVRTSSQSKCHNSVHDWLPLCRQRWLDIVKEVKGDPPRMSPDMAAHVLDHVKHDLRHSVPVLSRVAGAEELCGSFEAVYDLARSISSYAEIGEYGMTQEEKFEIARTFLRPMLRKLRWDLRVASGVQLGDEEQYRRRHNELYRPLSSRMDLEEPVAPGQERRRSSIESQPLDEPPLRSRLYFAHNSHLLSLVMLFRWAPDGGLISKEGEAFLAGMQLPLGYLCYMVLKLWRRASDGQLFVCMEFSYGDEGSCAHEGQIAQRHVLHEGVPVAEFDAFLSGLLDEAPLTAQEAGAELGAAAPAEQAPGV